MSSVPPAPPTLAAPRRIVTTRDAAGRSVQDNGIAVEPKALPRTNGIRFGGYWATTDGLPTNDNNSSDDAKRHIPNGLIQSGATNFRYTDLAPGVKTEMHRTSSIDYNILISGELVHITEDGVEKHLKNPGDALVQRGTLHAWRNPTDKWVRWATVLIDAKPAVVNGKEMGPTMLA